MSINIFFVLILGLLLGMYGYFAPNYVPQQEKREIPKIQLMDFTLYEISNKGIDHILEGKEGKKFDERYTVTSGKFSDNTKSLFQSIRSDNVVYQYDILNLTGNVYYSRADGLEFHSDEGTYDTNNSVIQTQGSFVITQNANRIDGEKLNYHTGQKTVTANQVRGSYQLK
ncbi:LPS export ABC transporter periplasmic protein LptC [Sulfuricurvum sp.]|uniref:LPS export ABC transporter periplasmic protein LptC n=1 Tax=Sulfuricurvum sp. TaxID=2025608 RepID=UPI003BAF584D